VVSIEYPEFNGVLNPPHLLNDFFVVILVDVGNDVANGFRRFEVLAGDVDTVIGKYMIDFSQYPRDIIVNVNQPVRIFMRGQRQVRKIDTVARAAGVDVVHQLDGHKVPDVFLGFRRASPDVGR
jgi:hypothetical protein